MIMPNRTSSLGILMLRNTEKSKKRTSRHYYAQPYIFSRHFYAEECRRKKEKKKTSRQQDPFKVAPHPRPMVEEPGLPHRRAAH